MSTVVPITVIIPTYNRTKVLFDTIESILSGIAVPDEVIVVDQTIPETIYPEILFSRYGSKLKIVREKIPSLTRSRNIGLDMAKNDIVLFCDDDVLLDRHSIEKLYCDMQNSKVALVAGINKKDNALYGGKNKDNQLKAFVSTLFGLKKFWRNDGYVIRDRAVCVAGMQWE